MIPSIKKLTASLFLSCGLLAATSGTASALTFDYADVDVINQSLTAGGGSSSFSGSFNFQPPDMDSNTFTAVGFGPADGTYNSVFGYQLGMPIIDGTITFFFKDPLGGTESGTVTANFTSTGGVTSFANYSVFSQGLEVAVLTTIVSSGVLNYVVTATSGNFDLIAGIGTITVNVPDSGATLAMLGGSMLGLAALRKRLARKA